MYLTHGGLSLDITLTHNIMSKYITRDKLTDFVEKMWDAGMRVDLHPDKNYITVTDSSYHSEYVNVFSKQSYDGLIQELTEKKEASNESDS